MSRTSHMAICMAITMVFSLIAGCGGGSSEDQVGEGELQAQFAGVQEAYDALLQVRAEAEAAQQTVAEIEAIPEGQRSDEQKAQLEEAQATAETASAGIEPAFETLQNQLADFLNVALNEAPESAEAAKALEIYSKEAILGAEDKVAMAGDYAKAIDQLNSAKSYYDAVGLTPYPALDEKIAEFEEWRFITPERLAQIKKGMTKDEVKEIAGVPYYANIMEDEEAGVETWMYKKAEGGAAAIYFRMKTDKVYDTNEDAVKTRVVE